MTIVSALLGVGLFGAALGGQFMSETASDQRQKLMWRQTMQVACLVLVVFFAIKLFQPAWEMLLVR